LSAYPFTPEHTHKKKIAPFDAPSPPPLPPALLGHLITLRGLGLRV